MYLLFRAWIPTLKVNMLHPLLLCGETIGWELYTKGSPIKSQRKNNLDLKQVACMEYQVSIELATRVAGLLALLTNHYTIGSSHRNSSRMVKIGIINLFALFLRWE